MNSLRNHSSRDVIKALKDFGFKPVRSRGSHLILKHPDGRFTTVPMHPIIKQGTLKNIILQTKITREEFLDHLK